MEKLPWVRTVQGDVPAASLGHTQCHEHIYLRKGPSYDVNPALCMDDFSRSLQELSDYRAAGGGAIVDAQPGDFGRDAAVLQALSARSGVAIVAVTGFHKLCFLEPQSSLPTLTVPALTARFIGEITQGMTPPDGRLLPARAGMVKAALTEGGLEDPAYRPLWEAAARTAVATGAPLMVHTDPGSDPLGLMTFLTARGVAPERVLLCHLDRTVPDTATHLALLRQGAYLCYDTIHRLKYHSDAEELSRIAGICRAGFSHRLVLSLDTTNERLRAYRAADMGLNYLLTDFLPMLRRAGVEHGQIRAMCRSNAAHLLSFRISPSAGEQENQT